MLRDDRALWHADFRSKPPLLSLASGLHSSQDGSDIVVDRPPGVPEGKVTAESLEALTEVRF